MLEKALVSSPNQVVVQAEKFSKLVHKVESKKQGHAWFQGIRIVLVGVAVKFR